jgi:hypothetical protein
MFPAVTDLALGGNCSSDLAQAWPHGSVQRMRLFPPFPQFNNEHLLLRLSQLRTLEIIGAETLTNGERCGVVAAAPVLMLRNIAKRDRAAWTRLLSGDNIVFL